MLSFNEGKACDAIIRHLEQRHNAQRSNVRSHDNDPEPDKRVELTFELGSTLYAVEHTGIEPFADFMRLNGENRRLFDPIIQQVSARLPGDEIVELHIPVGALFGKSRSELQHVQNALVDFVVASSASIPLRKYADYRRPCIALPVTPPDIPFAVTLYRFMPAPGVVAESNFMLRHNLPPNSEELRIARIRTACEKKFPKLYGWKKAHGARTVLILEDNDVQLTNQSNVTEAFLPIALGRDDRPDETYALITITELWYICPILVDHQTYFDLAESDSQSIFEVDPTTLDTITLR